MARWLKLTLTGLGLIGAGLGAATRFGSSRWNRATAQLVEKLLPPAFRRETGTVTFEDLDQLPAPVARYFRRTLREGQPLIRSARLVWDGEIRAREADDGWRPFEAQQHVSAKPAGFVWDARIRMAPLMPVRVRDAYVAGRGSTQVNILSLVTTADEQGKAELDAGALHRYLAEAVWLPTALLPSADIRWSPIDDSQALATLTDSGTTVSLEFRFNDAGEIRSVYTPGRYRAVNGTYALTPWEGHFRHYEERGGMWIPTAADVEWHLPDKKFPVWKGALADVDYEFAR